MADSEIAIPFGVEEIKTLIPHRYPFLFVDRIVSYTPGESIVGIKNISYSDPVLQGHFPGNPVMPGVLQIEAMAQTSAVYGRLTEPETTSCLLTEVRSARFRRTVVPGDVMTLELTLQNRRKNFFWFNGRVLVADQVAGQVEFSAKLD